MPYAYVQPGELYRTAMSGFRGMGQGVAPAICLDQNENSIACSDPNCAHGDCGSTAPQITIGSLCLDQQENQIACNDPNCTFGDCISSSGLSLTTVLPFVAIGVLALLLVGRR